MIEQKAELSHGEWLPWVMENCEFSERHARNYMEIANRQRVAVIDGASSIRGALRLLQEEKPQRKPQPEGGNNG